MNQNFPFNKLDKTHIDLEKSENFEIFQIEARRLVCPERFDFFANLIYIDHKEKNMNMNTATLIYKKRTEAMTNFTFKETGKEETKRCFDDYITSFDELIGLIKQNGIDKNISLIPIDKDNIPIDGSHRLSIAAYYNQMVTVVKFFDIAMIHITPDFLLYERFLDPAVVDCMMLEYIKWHTNIYMFLLWPKFFILEQEKIWSTYKEIKDNTNVIYKKKIKMKYDAVRNLMMQIYAHMDWIGTVDNHFQSTYLKANEVWDKNGIVEFVLVESDSLESITELKGRIRNICNIKLASMHSTDTYRETKLVSNLIYNSNSLHHLNTSIPDKFPKSFTLISKYKDIIRNYGLSIDDFIIDASMVLAVYGIREAHDLDYLAVNDTITIDVPDKIESHYSYLHYHAAAPKDLIYNPDNYFVFDELKFLSLERLLNFKKNKYNNTKEKKDIRDIKAIEYYRKKNRYKIQLLWIAILNKYHQRIFSIKGKIIIIIVTFLKKVRLYNCIRFIYHTCFKHRIAGI